MNCELTNKQKKTMDNFWPRGGATPLGQKLSINCFLICSFVTLLAMFSGNKLQVKFNKNIGFITPDKTKQSTKARTLILIILAISGNVDSNPGARKQNAAHKPRQQQKLRKAQTYPTGSTTFHNVPSVSC